MDKAMIDVEVAYATPARQAIVHVAVPAGTTLIEAVKQSDIVELFPELDVDNADMGIWSKPQSKDTVLKAGQRIEIYRPLLTDPKQARRKRASKRPPKR